MGQGMKIQISLVNKDGVVLCHETVKGVTNTKMGIATVKFLGEVASAEVNLFNQGIPIAAMTEADAIQAWAEIDNNTERSN